MNKQEEQALDAIDRHHEIMEDLVAKVDAFRVGRTWGQVESLLNTHSIKFWYANWKWQNCSIYSDKYNLMMQRMEHPTRDFNTEALEAVAELRKGRTWWQVEQMVGESDLYRKMKYNKKTKRIKLRLYCRILLAKESVRGFSKKT